MLRNILLTLSAGMVVALGAFALSQGGGASIDGGVAQKQAGSGDDGTASFEAKVISQLGLTKKQKSDYDALQLKIKNETKKMMELESGHMERGMEINKMLHAGLKKVFSKAQYAKYMKLWGRTVDNEPLGGGGSVNQKNAMGQGRTMPFGADTEEKILASLNLTEGQKKRVEELYVEMDIKIKEMKALNAAGDTMAGGLKSGEINKFFRDGMKRILTAEQYASYKQQWDAIMAPYLNKGGAHSPARMMVPGRNAPEGGNGKIAGKAGG